MEYKGFKIEGDGTFGYKLIKPLGKGSVPLELRGKYTKAVFAQEDIDKYLEGKQTNGDTKRTSRGK